jgi:putative DNA primase/helicase
VPAPIIKIIRGEFSTAIDQTEAALLQVGARILQRAGQLVEPISQKRPAADGRKTQVTILKPLTPLTLAYRLTQFGCTFKRRDVRSKKWKAIDPPDRIMRGLLERGEWQFPTVTGVISVPTLRPDGSILQKCGYDVVTGLWLEPDANVQLPAIPDDPSEAEARAALNTLLDLLKEFGDQALPIYWAGFTLVGDGSTVIFKQ